MEKIKSLLLSDTLWLTIGEKALIIILIIIVAYIVRTLTHRIINGFFKEKKLVKINITTTRREETIKNLLKNASSYIISFIVIVMILDVLGVPIGTILAGAGVVGLAVGFGAQSLVKDVISGFFIIFEDQFSVDDYIQVTGLEGTVEVIGLRTTKIQGFEGEQYVIPNGNIQEVVNYSIHNGLSIVDINLPYESNIELVEKEIKKIITGMAKEHDEFVNDPKIFGVQMLELSNYVLRVVADTQPTFQWAGARIIRKEIQDKLYQQGIEIPSPRIVVYNREKEGMGGMK